MLTKIIDRTEACILAALVGVLIGCLINIARAQTAPPPPAQVLVQDWQILTGSKAAMDGALQRLQADLSAVLQENAKLKADLAEAQKAKVSAPATHGMSPR